MVKVVIAGEGEIAAALANWYRASGAEVLEQPLEARAVAGPVDLLVVADGYAPPAGPVDNLDRAKLGEAMHRIAFLPFHIATQLKPQLAEAKGRAVLISRADARMEVPDSTGRYLERPFRAGAHTLWRSLSVEWREAGISIGLVGIAEGELPPVEELAGAIAGREEAPFPVELTDIKGQVLGW